MGTTAQKLNKILETKEAIRTAINNKGGTLTTTDTFASYPSAIDNLPSGGGNTLKTLLDATKSCYNLFYNYSGASIEGLISYNDTENVKTTYGMFFQCTNLTTISLFNTTNVTNMTSMFAYCSKLETIPLFNTTNVTIMNNLCQNCTNLTTIPQIDTRNVKNMNAMFNNCSKLITIPQLNSDSATSMSNTFRYCSKLKTIDITRMSASNNTNFANNCNSLTKLIIRNMDTIPTIDSSAFTNCYHFTGTTNATYNPNGLKDGRIYVPDDKVDALKTASGWSTYADIIVPLSTLVE